MGIDIIVLLAVGLAMDCFAVPVTAEMAASVFLFISKKSVSL